MCLEIKSCKIPVIVNEKVNCHEYGIVASWLLTRWKREVKDLIYNNINLSKPIFLEKEEMSVKNSQNIKIGEMGKGKAFKLHCPKKHWADENNEKNEQ